MSVGSEYLHPQTTTTTDYNLDAVANCYGSGMLLELPMGYLVALNGMVSLNMDGTTKRVYNVGL